MYDVDITKHELKCRHEIGWNPNCWFSYAQAQLYFQYEDTFDDFLEMFIQFGYVILFSSAFPLAALCALLNNIVEIRSDAFKLCMHHQRPFAKRVESIGIWQVSHLT